MLSPAVERIRREEYTQQELLRMFKEASEEAMTEDELNDAHSVFASGLDWGYQSRAGDYYNVALIRIRAQ